MDRTVTVSTSAGAAADVQLRVPDTATVADLLPDLGAVACSAAGEVWRGGRRLDPRTPVRELADGDLLRLEDAGGGPTAVLTLEVTAGPDAGRVVGLPPGRHVIGRDGALSLGDQLLSRRHVELLVAVDGVVAVTDLGSSNGTFVGGERLRAGAPVAWPPDVELLVGLTRMAHGRLTAPAAVTPGRGGTMVVSAPPRLRAAAAPAVVRFPAPPQLSTPGRLPLVASVAPLVAGLLLAVVLRRWEFLAFAVMSPLVVLGQAGSDRWSARRTNRTATRAHGEAVEAAARDLEAALTAEAAARRAAAPDLAQLVQAATQPTDLLWQRRLDDVDALRVRLGLGEVPAATVVEGAPPPEPLPDVPVVLDLTRAGVVGVVGDAASASGLARSLVLQVVTLHGPSSVRVAVLAPGRGGRWAWVRWLPHARTGPASARIATTTAQVRALLDELTSSDGETRTFVVVDGVLDGAVADALAGRPETVVLWVAQGPAAPAACTTVVEPADQPGSVRVLRSGDEPLSCRVDRVATDVAEEVARALAPLRDVAAAGAGLPTTVAWSQLHDVPLADPSAAASALARRWRSGPSTQVALGVTADGPLLLDLQRDGPHVLVAGTTGAGKSELLQSMVCSLVAGNSPADLNLLLVDFKGGAAFGPCAQLPHTVGVLTDLDAAATTRALASLSAELRRRERALAAAGAADLTGSGLPIPRLAIVVDEFATLADELPDFVGGLVGIAQRGRSLGVHLVLATQRPEGSVSHDIRANTRLRICLAVAREAESRDVVDSPCAAGISRSTPGRAFVRIGTHELREVQTARVSGAHAATGPAVRIVPLPAWSEAPAPAPAADGAATELELLADAAARAAATLDQPRATPPWLPPLPAHVATVPAGCPGDDVAIGLVDLPDQQQQPPLQLSTSRCDPLLVVGGARSGRTTAALTIATTLAAVLPPDDLHVYAVDSGRGLAALQSLPHTGAVVDVRDVDRVERMLMHLTSEVERRRDRPDEDDPQLLLVVDTWDGLLAAAGDVDAQRCQDLLLRLVSTGASGRLRLVVAGDRSALTGRLGGSVRDKLCLRLADRSDYAMLGLAPRQVPTELPDGRALRASDLAWTQLARVDDATRAAASAWTHPARPPRRFDPLPRRVPLHAIPAGRGLVVGVRSDDLAPLVLDPGQAGVLLVAGPPGSGRSTTLVTVATQLRDRPVVALCPRRGPLQQRRDLALVADPARPDELDRALAAAADGGALLVDDIDLVDDPRALDGIEAAVRRARDRDSFVVLAGATDAMAATFRGPVAQARRSRVGLLLRPEGPHDGDLLGVRLRRRTAHADPPGRGVLALNGSAVPVQVPDPG